MYFFIFPLKSLPNRSDSSFNFFFKKYNVTKDAFHLVTQINTNIVLSLLLIECQER